MNFKSAATILAIVALASLLLGRSLIADQAISLTPVKKSQLPDGASTPRSKTKDATSTTLIDIIQKESVLAASGWSVDNPDFTTSEYFCIVTESAKPPKKSLGERTMTFYENKSGKLTKIYSEVSPDFFNSMYPIRDLSGSHLVTVWGAGSGSAVSVFSLSSGKVRVVLQGAAASVEVADIDNDGTDEIIITEQPILMDHATKKIVSYPDSATVYKWNGEVYKALWTKPWKERMGERK